MARVRTAVRQDIPRIIELYEDLTEEKLDLSAETIERVFSEIAELPEHNFLVAEEDGFVLGTLFVLIVPNLSHNAHPWGCIENVVVDRRFRGKGIGHLLMESAAEFCREAGCYKIQLLSHKKRLEAHKFYRALGYEDSALGFRLYL